MAAFGKLAFGLALVFLIGIGATTQSWFPGSTISAQERLQRNAEHALTIAGADWAQIRVDGQKAILSGIAPSTKSQTDTVAAVKGAVWRGGIVMGGITTIDAPSATIATSATGTTTAIAVAETETIATVNPSAIAADTQPEELPAQLTEATDTQTDTIIDSTIDPVTDESSDRTNIAVVPEDDAIAPPPQPTIEEQCQSTLDSAINSHKITFATARSEIDAASRAHLLDIAEALNACPDFSLQISGHTDSSGSSSRNRQLSLFRADAVATYLRSVGVVDTRLQTQGLGSTEPIASNANPDGRAINRRIEFTLIPNQSD